MPGNHCSRHQSVGKALAAASVLQEIGNGQVLCLESWHSVNHSSGFRLQAYVTRTWQVDSVGYFHDTQLGITVFINSNLQGQHLLIKERKPCPMPSSP
jgi:hypothetical protein